MAKRLTAEQVAAFWLLAGQTVTNDFKEVQDAAGDAVSQAYVESGFDPDAISSKGYVGLWQCGTDRDALPPLANANCAVGKWAAAGHSFVRDWTNFQAAGTEAKRLAYLPRAKLAANKVKRKADCGNGGCDGDTLSKIAGKGGTKVSGDFSLGDALDAANPIDDVAEAIMTVVKPIGDFFKIITSADTWIRVGKVALGALVLLLVANELTKGTALAGAVRRGR